MRVSATHIVLEVSGTISDAKIIFHKVYELSDGEYMIEMDNGIQWLQPEVFIKWSDNYKDYYKTK